MLKIHDQVDCNRAPLSEDHRSNSWPKDLLSWSNYFVNYSICAGKHRDSTSVSTRRHWDSTSHYVRPLISLSSCSHLSNYYPM